MSSNLLDESDTHTEEQAGFWKNHHHSQINRQRDFDNQVSRYHFRKIRVLRFENVKIAEENSALTYVIDQGIDVIFTLPL